MTRNKGWLREFTEVVCPKCDVNYLIRDKHKYCRAKKIKLDTINGKIIKRGKIKKRDNLECVECGIIRKYKGEKTTPYTEDNYHKYLGSHGTLQYIKYKKKRREKHIARLYALKNLKKLAPYEIVEKYLGKEYMILSIMESINRIGFSIRVILLSAGHDKSKVNTELLRFLIDSVKENFNGINR